MSVTLRVQFQGRLLCLKGGLFSPTRSFAASAQDWANQFGTVFGFAYSTGLLTLPSSPPKISALGHGSLYVTAPDSVTPNTFASLARNWTRDCIVVDKITQVESAPDASSEQAVIDGLNDDDPTTGSWWKKAKDLLSALVHDTLLILALLLAALVIYELWRSGKLRKWIGRKGKR